MKALKFLKEFEKDINYFIDSFDEYSYDEGLHTAKIYKIKIFEAIEELEALQNRSCENCRHLEKKEKNLKFECLLEVCRTCTRNNNDNWEPK